MTDPATAEATAETTPGESPPERSWLFGYPFDNLTQETLVDRMGHLIKSGGRSWIATINVNLLCLGERDSDYGKVLSAADVITADGMPILWMSRLRRRPLLARVTGADLLVPLALRAQSEGWRIFLAGGAPGVAESVVERLKEIAPKAEVVGTITPPLMSYEELIVSDFNREMLQHINEAKPHVLLMALGSPKQERWIEHHIRSGELEVPISVGVGAAFDFQAGSQSRAPRLLQKLGLEWFYRMTSSPRRLLPRYAKDAFTFGRLCLREMFGLNAPKRGDR